MNVTVNTSGAISCLYHFPQFANTMDKSLAFIELIYFAVIVWLIFDDVWHACIGTGPVFREAYFTRFISRRYLVRECWSYHEFLIPDGLLRRILCRPKTRDFTGYYKSYHELFWASFVLIYLVAVGVALCNKSMVQLSAYTHIAAHIFLIEGIAERVEYKKARALAQEHPYTKMNVNDIYTRAEKVRGAATTAIIYIVGGLLSSVSVSFLVTLFGT